MRGIVIAGTHSGSGKTTVALGVMAALRKKGLTVQPFKAGPDFIDAGLHRLAAGRVSRNLDLWMCGPGYVKECFARHAAGADIAVVEGVMGLYDGDRSTASLAALLGARVVLVVDACGMAESAGAVVKGFVEFGARSAEHEVRNAECGVRSERLNFAGVIFNRVASENHYARLKNSVKGMPVLGYLPRETEFEIPHRHLGLTTAEEDPLGRENMEKLADAVLRHIDLEGLVPGAAGRAKHPPLQGEGQGGDGGGEEPRKQEGTRPHPGPLPEGEGAPKIRIAVAYDRAFCFYYEDNLDLLREAGAEIIRFSPLSDAALPDADAVYIGGGYPELHAETLSRNSAMRAAIRAWTEAGKPLYAECGGLMYLSHAIEKNGEAFPMAGVFPFETRMLGKPRLGYREVVLREDCIIGRPGDIRRGHEFHYSEIAGGASGTTYRVGDNRGKILPDEGFRYKRTLASYIHLHFGSDRQCASRLISAVAGEVNA